MKYRISNLVGHQRLIFNRKKQQLSGIFNGTMLSEIGEIMQRSVSRYSKCCSCPTLTRNFLLLWLLSLSAGVACSFNKCCPFGEVFSGMSKVDCVASPRAPQIVASDPTNKNVTYGQLPICQKPEYITTLSLDEINSADILQVRDSGCLFYFMFVNTCCKSCYIKNRCRSCYHFS